MAGVKFGDLGTFYLTLSSRGTEQVEDFDPNSDIKGVRLRFLPNRTQINDLSSPMLRKSSRVMNIEDLTPTDKDADAPGTE